MSIPAPGMTRYVAVVEDNVSDVELVRYALTAAGVETRLQIFADGDEAYRLIAEVESGAAPCPILFLLDLNLPKRSGRQVLQRIRASKHCGDIPVVVLSSSDAPEDKQDALTLGANRYLTKPIDLDDYLQVGQILKTYIEPSG